MLRSQVELLVFWQLANRRGELRTRRSRRTGPHALLLCPFGLGHDALAGAKQSARVDTFSEHDDPSVCKELAVRMALVDAHHERLAGSLHHDALVREVILRPVADHFDEDAPSFGDDGEVRKEEPASPAVRRLSTNDGDLALEPPRRAEAVPVN
jgi:hypothetical protein